MFEVLRPFGDYVLLGELGRGATSVVYQARHTTLNRSVALKVIRAAGALSSGERRRFRTEAEAAAALNHPHIVAVHEVGEQDGAPFLAMELMPGGTLAERLSAGPLDLRAAAVLLAPVTRAVHHAHQRGVLHRDLKPGNILLDAGGQPRLSDFGLAKLTYSDTGITHSQAIFGTPAYMSPEVVTGGVQAATTAADIYGLGAILYEMLAGRPPFVADNVPALLRKIAHDELLPPSRTRTASARARTTPPPDTATPAWSLSGLPPPSPVPAADAPSGTAGVPRDLEAICLRCLARDPQARYASADALADDLERFLRSEPVSARLPSPAELLRYWLRRHRVAVAWGTALLVCLLAGLGFSLTQWVRAEKHLAESNGSRERLTRLVTSQTEDLFDTSQAHNGVRLLAELLQHSPGNRLVAMRLFGALTQRAWCWPLIPPLLHEGDVVQAEFTPDGHSIVTASRQDSAVRIWDADAGKLCQRLSHDSATARFTLSRDGAWLATLGANGQPSLWALSGPHANARTIPSAAPVTALAFTAQGRQLATGDEQGAIHLWDIARGERVPLPALPVLSEPVRHLLFHPQDVTLLAVGTHVARLWRLPEGIPMGPEIVYPEPIREAAFAPNRPRFLLVTTNRAAVWDGNQGRLIHEQRPAPGVTAASLDADRDRLAVAVGDHRVRIFDLNTGRPLPAQHLRHDRIQSVRFSHDGVYLLITEAGFAATALRVGESIGGFELMQHSATVHDALFSPDSKRVLTFSADRTARLWGLDAPFETTYRVPDLGAAADLKFTPDGAVLVGIHTNGIVQLVGTADGQELARIAMPRTPTAWDLSDAGLRLAVGDGEGEIRFVDLTSQSLAPNRLRQPEPMRFVRLSPDDSRLASAGASQVFLWQLDAGGTNPITVSSHDPRSLGRESAPSRSAPDRDQRRLTSAATGFMSPGHAPLATVALPEPQCLAFSPDSKRLAVSGLGETTARILDTVGGGALGICEAHNTPLEHLRFSPDNSLLATVSQGGQIRLWNAADARPVTAWISIGAPVTGMEFRPDSALLAVASRDLGVRFFDTRSGAQLSPALTPPRGALSVDYSPDGAWMLTTGVRRTARLWGADSRLPASEILTFPGQRAAGFSRDGQGVLVSAKGAAFIWRSPEANRSSVELLLAMAELVTGQRLEAGVAPRDLTPDEFRDRQRALIAYHGRPAPGPHLTAFR